MIFDLCIISRVTEQISAQQIRRQSHKTSNRVKGILWIQGFKNKLIVKKKVASKKLKKLKHSFRKNTTHHNITFQMCICFRIYLFYLFKITTRQTCSEKLCDKNIHFFGFTPYTHVCFKSLYEYLYLAWKYSSSEIFFQYVFLSTVVACTNIFDIFVFIWDQKFSGTVRCHTISYITEIAPKMRTEATTLAEGSRIFFINPGPETSWASIISLFIIITYLVLFLFLIFLDI